MAKFSEAVHGDLESIRKKMADNARAADSYLESALNNVNDWTAKLKHAFQSASKDVEVSCSPVKRSAFANLNSQDVDTAMDSITKNSKTAAHMMNQFVKNMYESTAEVSAVQEKALVVGTNEVQRRMDSISNQLRATEDGLATVAALINVWPLKNCVLRLLLTIFQTLVPMVVSLSERVEASEMVSQKPLVGSIVNMSVAIIRCADGNVKCY